MGDIRYAFLRATNNPDDKNVTLVLYNDAGLIVNKFTINLRLQIIWSKFLLENISTALLENTKC